MDLFQKHNLITLIFNVRFMVYERSIGFIVLAMISCLILSIVSAGKTRGQSSATGDRPPLRRRTSLSYELD